MPQVHSGSAIVQPAGPENKTLLRILICGRVDAGKSTLIARMLFDARQIFEGHPAALGRDYRKHGSVEDDTDFALLVDGLEAERGQGITIDVAYRYFSTAKRKFIVGDTPGTNNTRTIWRRERQIRNWR